MSMATFHNVMGQTIFPKVSAKTFPDTLTVRTLNETSGTGGQKIKSSTTDSYTSVPCRYERIQKFGWRKDQAERNISTQVYKVEMPTHTAAGARINLNSATQRLTVAARGNEPAFTLRITHIGNERGLRYEVIATKEN